jgi:hypothetical protein
MSETTDVSTWHQDFIASNLLVIGYNAWAGHLSHDRGAIICSTTAPAVGIAGESFKTHFVARPRLAPFLNAWLAATDTGILPHHLMNAHILEAVDTYNPATGAVLLMESFNRATFFYLKNLPITPPQCYAQICQNWDEFQPGTNSCQNAQLQGIEPNYLPQPNHHRNSIGKY